MSQDKARWILEDALEKVGFDSQETEDLLKRFVEESKDES
jgi:hypothetical protein